MEYSKDSAFLDRPPLLSIVAKEMLRHNIRGGWRVNVLLERAGYFKNKIVKYDLKPGYAVFVPLYRRERWDRTDLVEYERSLVSALVHAGRECAGPITLIDCGADIGLISVSVAAELNQVNKIVALEPSGEAYPVLQKTLAGLPFESKAIQVGVSDFTGRGDLRSPPYDASHHARYLVQVPGGGFPVTTIDALSIGASNIILKIDVEGGEIGVIRGAGQTLAAASKAVISVEAHPRVFDRTGIDPIAILREIAAIRSFRFVVAETGKSDLDLNRPFFEQIVNDGTIYNIVCSSQ